MKKRPSQMLFQKKFCHHGALALLLGSSHHQASCKKSDASSLFNRAHSNIIVGKKIITLAEIKRRLLLGNASSFLAKSKKLRILWGILIILTKFPTNFLKYSFQIYGRSKLFIYFTRVDSD